MGKIFSSLGWTQAGNSPPLRRRDLEGGADFDYTHADDDGEDTVYAPLIPDAAALPPNAFSDPPFSYSSFSEDSLLEEPSLSSSSHTDTTPPQATPTTTWAADRPPPPPHPPNAFWLRQTNRRPVFARSMDGTAPSSCPYIDCRGASTVGVLYVNASYGGLTTADFAAGFAFCDELAGYTLRLISEGTDFDEPGSPLSLTLPGVRVVQRPGVGTATILTDRHNPRLGPKSMTTTPIDIWPGKRINSTTETFCIEYCLYVGAIATDNSIVVYGQSTDPSKPGAVFLFVTFWADTRLRQNIPDPVPFTWDPQINDLYLSPDIGDVGPLTSTDVVYALSVTVWAKGRDEAKRLSRSEGWIFVFLEHKNGDDVICFSAWLFSSHNKVLPMGVISIGSGDGGDMHVLYCLLRATGITQVCASAYLAGSRKEHPQPYCRISVATAHKENHGCVLAQDREGFELGYAPVGTDPQVRNLSRHDDAAVLDARTHFVDTGMCELGAWDVQAQCTHYDVTDPDNNLLGIEVSIKGVRGHRRSVISIRLSGNDVFRATLHTAEDRPGALVFVLSSPHTHEGKVVASFIVILIDAPTGTMWAVSPLGTTPRADMIAALASCGIELGSVSDDVYREVYTEAKQAIRVESSPVLGIPTLIFDRRLPPPPPPPRTASETPPSPDPGYSMTRSEYSYEAESRTRSESASYDKVCDEDLLLKAGPSEHLLSPRAPPNRILPGLIPSNVLLFEGEIAVILPMTILHMPLNEPIYSNHVSMSAIPNHTRTVFRATSTSDAPQILSAQYYSCPALGEPFASTFSAVVLDGDQRTLGVAALADLSAAPRSSSLL